MILLSRVGFIHRVVVRFQCRYIPPIISSKHENFCSFLELRPCRDTLDGEIAGYIMSASKRSRQLYAAPTQSSLNKSGIGAAAEGSMEVSVGSAHAPVRRNSVSPPPPAVASGRTRSGSATSTSALTIAAKSIHSSPSARSQNGQLRRDQLSAIALGLGEPLPLRRASPATGARPKAGSSQRPLWSVSPRPASSAPQSTHQSSAVNMSQNSGNSLASTVNIAPGSEPVRVVIASHGNEALSFIRDPVEQCVVLANSSGDSSPAAGGGREASGSGQYYCDASFMTNTERRELGGKVADQIARQITFQGNHSVVFGFGAPGSGKTESLYGADGAAPRYISLLLDELDRTFLSKLWSVHVAVLNVVDGQAFDALPQAFQSRRHAAHDPQDALMAMLEGNGEDNFTGRRSSANVLNVLRGGAGSEAVTAHSANMQCEPRELLEKLAVTIRDADDIDLFFETIAQRARSRHNVTWQEVVYVCVVPSLGVQQTFGGLMRSVGSACFVELGAGMSADDELRMNTRAANAQRHTVTTVINVLNALTRSALQQKSVHVPQPSSPNSPAPVLSYAVHVPFGDSTLTTLLEPFLQDCHTTLIAHVHEDPEERTASLSTLHAVDQILRHRYPNGKAPIDYKVLARTQCLRAEKLEKEYEAAKRYWDSERQQLESDRWMLRKAYDDLLQQCDDIGGALKSTSSRASHNEGTTSPTSSSAGNAFPSSAAASAALTAAEERARELNQSNQSLKAMLSQVQREKCVLEEHVAVVSEDLNVLRDAHARLQHDRDVLLERYREHEQRKGGAPKDQFAESPIAEAGKLLADVLGFLSTAELVSFPGGGSQIAYKHSPSQTHSSALLIIRSVVALLQLAHQLAEREKICSLVVAGPTTDGLTGSPNRKGSMTSKAAGASRLTPSHADPNTAPPPHLLKWQTWRALLERLHRIGQTVVDQGNLFAAAHAAAEGSHNTGGMAPSDFSLVHVNGTLPKVRNYSNFALFHLAASSSPSVFLDFWISEHSSSVPAPPPRTSSALRSSQAQVPQAGAAPGDPVLGTSFGLLSHSLLSAPPSRQSTAAPLPAGSIGDGSAAAPLTTFASPRVGISQLDRSSDSARAAAFAQLVGREDPSISYTPNTYSFPDDEPHEDSALERLSRQLTSSLDARGDQQHRISSSARAAQPPLQQQSVTPTDASRFPEPHQHVPTPTLFVTEPSLSSVPSVRAPPGSGGGGYLDLGDFASYEHSEDDGS